MFQIRTSVSFVHLLESFHCVKTTVPANCVMAIYKLIHRSSIDIMAHFKYCKLCCHASYLPQYQQR